MTHAARNSAKPPCGTQHAPRPALIHDWLNQLGGAENVLETLVRMYPAAPVFTSMYAAEIMRRPSVSAWIAWATWPMYGFGPMSLGTQSSGSTR